MISRRAFVGTLAGGLAAPALLRGRAVAADEVKVATMFDQSGGLDIYGKPMQMSAALAIEEINAAGGLNGKQIRVVNYDTQSNMQLYAEYAQQASLREQVTVVHGTITSASREVIRPILDRNRTLLMCPQQYEGGVCDKNVFLLGCTPTMQVKEPLKWAIKEYGKKIYFIGADYNAPRIQGDWTKKYAKEYGAEVIAADFFPLDVTEFGPAITKIQQAKPDLLVSMLVGAAHVGFYRQWAAAGLVGKVPMLSYTFGIGNEHIMLPASVTDGIVAPYDYFQELTLPENVAFLDRFRKRYGDAVPYLNTLAADAYQSVMLWSKAVSKAGSFERDKVVAALESGVEVNGPGGLIKIDGRTHHAAHDMFLGRLKDQKWTIIQTWANQTADDAGGKCDLIANPRTNQQFLPDL
jgi:branched-chain amino acid transport system substrate-binding protein